MAYNARAAQGGKKNTSKKVGGPSAKHRGYKPEADAARGGKKPRWSSEQRVANGRGVERPRGQRQERAEDGRPNWEPRGKDARNSVERAPAARKRDTGYGERRDDRGRTDRPRTDRFVREDDAPRRDGYRDRDGVSSSRSNHAGDRPHRLAGDRPQRHSYGTDRPRRDDDRARDDRPARSYDDRPRTERFVREDDAPRRDGYRGRDGVSSSRTDKDARPRREYGDRPQRDDRRGGYRDDRGGYRDERPRRDDRPRYEERPRRDYDDRPRRDFGDREDRAPRPQVEDVVLERLEAQATLASDVEGMTFGDLGLGQNIVRELEELGATSPFAIQAATIPDVLSGGDVLGRGRTGSGKTIAFGAPLVERLLRMQAGDQKRREFGRAPRALILAPTRELALQIDRTVQPIARSVGLFTTQIYGGVPYARQLGALERGVDIVIGTPGRIQDLSASGKLDLSKVVITVLDEADHMCELGFAEPVTEILDRTAEGGQRLLFSATLDKGVADIVERYLKDPAVHEVAGEDQASSTIEHRVLLLDQRDKQEVLVELASGPGKKLVFARTRAFAEQLADLLDDAGIRAESIHGDLTQSRRQRALDKFANGRVQALVATDVAARGIHVDDVSLVIQADAPDEYKAYLHRAGRTGRAGKEGTVVTLVPRNRRRRTEELLQRADIVAEWTPVVPGDDIIRELADR
ncbi:DEAD/DEAH box helicase [Protaetiibacter intestinalis]|uniref:DEAD/DEAH box helicase n=1 Tax=Protaetiibacter intestinalis TaxID=2419774 RepID=A0A387B9B8_9MICO|nr:DEAD/DEAH box helicase [Protaetiibacter intestinalis]AYF97696.1 DEAD/DEAH box helicase [Protaetiibacter intestinalis]